MVITIDGKPADIVLEKEKNIGELLGGIGDWLAGSGYSLSGLSINGELINAASINDAFDRPLEGIKVLDIRTTGLPLLMAEALVDIQQDISAYGNASFEDQRRIQREWEESPSASFLAERIPDLFDRISRSFRGEGLAAAALAALVDERLRELRDPLLELSSLESLVEATAKRLEDLPLDIQTGKDSRAAETVQLFSNIAEKLFRLFSLLKLEGIITDTITIDTMPFNAFIDDFSAALKELLAAYEVKDAVLVGDLAEYELAPRLRTFYSAIKTPAAA
ncbi:hypothetical protein [Treponema primitia]|uniref:hypothetical protein n=1 Tax=Treponema primitia TaxID=88058 RepID=UPI000255574A|nr:hypothetical protein [Treponema primitia]